MNFSGFIGHEKAKLALILNAVDPHCGGVLFLGEKGCGKSTLARLFKRILPGGTPFAELPLNATEEAILGGMDLEEAIRTGRRCYQPGILKRAHGGFVYVDDVNLMANEILALLIHVQGRGANLVEREGLTLAHDADFQVIASMNMGDNSLSPHILDRFGMAVAWSRITEAPQRMAVVRASVAGLTPAIDDGQDSALRDAILGAKTRLARTAVPAAIEEYIAARCTESLAAGHRAELFLRSAARAFTAFQGRSRVEQQDVDAVLPLVLDHRRRIASPPPQEQEQDPPPPPQQDQQKKDPPPPPPNDELPDEHSPQDNVANDSPPKPRESAPLEQIFGVGETFPIRRLHFRRDRIMRGASGRKLKTLSRDKRGRYIRSRNRGSLRDIALDATIRAAAPLQQVRGAADRLDIRPEDFRYKEREKKIGHLAVFVVDGSGSMGAQRRMVAAKGAIESLLLDSYQKRDKVAMVLFRKDRAEVVLPPTSSVHLASRLLRALPVGGKTPLSAGLYAAYELVRLTMLREPEVRVLITLVTDGKANHSMTEAPPAEEVSRIVAMLRDMPFTEFLVVDTENKSSLVKTGACKKISAELGADYFPMDELRSDTLVSLIQSKKVAERSAERSGPQ
jgi:magnesium chelatase subunit D